MQIKIRERQDQIDQELSALPELPFSNVFMIVVQHLGVFTGDIQRIMDGGSTHNGFHSSFSKLCDQFRETILSMKPKMTVSHPSDKGKIVVDLCDSDGEEAGSTTSVPTPKSQHAGVFGMNNIGKRVHPDLGMQTPSKRPRPTIGSFDGAHDTPAQLKQENLDSIPFRLTTPVRQTPIPEARDPNPFARILASHQKGQPTSMSIAKIRAKIEEHAKAGHPGVVSPMVYTELKLDSVSTWETPCLEILNTTIKMLRHAALESLHHVFAKWQQTQLYQQSMALLNDFFDKLAVSQKNALLHLCSLEANNDFTVNKAAMEMYKNEEAAGISKIRQEVRAREVIRMSGRQFKGEKAEEQRKAAEKQAEKELPQDPFTQELEVAAYVRGYYKTAALRFVDSVCLSIHGKLFHEVREQINFYLEEQLNIYEGGKLSILRAYSKHQLTCIRRRALS